MKKMLLMVLAAGLMSGAGCSRQEDESGESVNDGAIAEQCREAALQTQQKAAEVTEQAEGLAGNVSQETRKAVDAMTVKAEDVMADLSQSVDQIKEKAAAFDKSQLLAHVDQYKNILLEKKDQIAALTEQVQALSVTELMGEKATALKEQLTNYTEQFNGLKERYTVYLDALKEYGIDLSADSLQ